VPKSPRGDRAISELLVATRDMKTKSATSTPTAGFPMRFGCLRILGNETVKRDPYRVLMEMAKITRVTPAETLTEAMAIAEVWRIKHGHFPRIYRWNSDDQRYLLVRGGGK